jgi:hypothetical protein
MSMIKGKRKFVSLLISITDKKTKEKKTPNDQTCQDHTSSVFFSSLSFKA